MMSRPSTRQALWFGLSLSVALTATIVLYHFAALPARELPRRIHGALAWVPVIVPMVIAQFVRYETWIGRFGVTVLIALLAAITMLVVALVLGCGFYDGCS